MCTQLCCLWDKSIFYTIEYLELAPKLAGVHSLFFFSLNWFISGKEACQTFIKGVFSTPVPPFLGKVKHVFQLG